MGRGPGGQHLWKVPKERRWWQEACETRMGREAGGTSQGLVPPGRVAGGRAISERGAGTGSRRDPLTASGFTPGRVRSCSHREPTDRPQDKLHRDRSVFVLIIQLMFTEK